MPPRFYFGAETGPNSMSAKDEVIRRIRERGRITFAEYMETALYWADGGYYASTGPGAEGDYYTAPQAHPAFGSLIAVQLFQMWDILDRPDLFRTVEVGAGNGRLCHDVMSFSTQLPDGFSRALRYVCIDRAASQGLETTLPPDLESKVERFVSHTVPLQNVVGCFLSNELPDAFPVHRVIMEGGEFREIFVAEGPDGTLVEEVGKPSTGALATRLEDLDVTLEEGQQAEINLGLGPWMKAVSNALQQGYVITVDYGGLAPEVYAAHRRQGTLSGHFNHTLAPDPLQRTGHQDLTSHVDFTTIVREGSKQGLAPVGLTTQRRFLNKLGLDRFTRKLRTLGLTQSELDANRMGMLDLVRPGGMGEFKVLTQSKGVEQQRLWGMEGDDRAAGLIEEVKPPLLTPAHIGVLSGRYPHLAGSLPEGTWADLLGDNS